MFYIYILFSQNSNVFYIGHSDDPWNRIIQHNTKEKGTFSSKHKPWKLVATFQAGNTRGGAIILERFIKKQKSRKLIENLVNPEFIPENKLIQLVRVPHLRD
jgi:putative endonuclease